MPLPIFMILEGSRQGLISAGAFAEPSVGNLYQIGREDRIMVQALSHGIYVPEGVEAGRRIHKPLVITKLVDKASPLIQVALCSGEVMSTCRLEWYRLSAQGAAEHFYTMELDDARGVATDVLTSECQDPASVHVTQVEKIQFSYRRICWRHEVSRTRGSDEWQGEARG